MGDVDLGGGLEAFVDGLVANGSFTSTDAVLREAVRLLEDRERRRAEIDAAIRVGLADAAAGRHKPMDEVFDRIEARMRGLEAAE